MSAVSLLGADSDVARCLFRGHTKGNKVRPNAFMPPEEDLRLPVCVVDGLDAEAIHRWGKEHASTEDRPARGYALLHVKDILAEDLTVERDDHPPLHADVFGWPIDKDARLDIAKQLVQATVRVELL